jgi:hypothetical protein
LPDADPIDRLGVPAWGGREPSAEGGTETADDGDAAHLEDVCDLEPTQCVPLSPEERERFQFAEPLCFRWDRRQHWALGVGAASLVDLPHDARPRAYAGAGLGFSRSVARDALAIGVGFDALARPGADAHGEDTALLASARLRWSYGDLWRGCHRRRDPVPYLGVDAGYARVAGHGALLAGGVLGLRLLTLRLLAPASIDLSQSIYASFDESDPAHAAFRLALGVNWML